MPVGCFKGHACCGARKFVLVQSLTMLVMEGIVLFTAHGLLDKLSTLNPNIENPEIKDGTGDERQTDSRRLG